MTIKAIPTSYAGHQFRSRLEARWAVFLDALGIAWQYEPQGFEIRESLGTLSRPYLPDFWLPGSRLWVEVKGSPEAMSNRLMVDASIPGSGLPADPDGTEWVDGGPGHPLGRNSRRIIILGPLPVDTPYQVDHPTTYFHEGDVFLLRSTFGGRHVYTHGDTDYDSWIGGDHDRFAEGDGRLRHDADLVTANYFTGDLQGAEIRAAYTKARKAQFEHGRQS